MPTAQTPRANPRTRRTFGGRPNSVWYALGLLLILGLAQMYFLDTSTHTLPYSEFKSLIKQGAIEEVTIGDQFIHGTLKQPVSNDPKQSKQFTATRVDDPKLT